jgi:glycine/D-amino acid oxidase-like deaminating enzyme
MSEAIYDVIVIGGGIAGAATAYFLAKDGVATLLLERGELNTVASGTNAGSLHVQIPFGPFINNGPGWLEGFKPVVPFLLEAAQFWRRLGQPFMSEAELTVKGGVIAATSENELRQLERKVKVERALGLTVQELDRTELLKLAPYFSGNMVGGAYYPQEGKANPQRVVPFFAGEAERSGARIVRHAEVLDVLHARDLYTVQTNTEIYQARRVVNAAGAAAGRIAAMVGVKLHTEAHPLLVSETEVGPELVPHLVYSTAGKLSLKQTARGTFFIGGGWPGRIDAQGRAHIDEESLRHNLEVAYQVVPAVQSLQVMRTWVGLVNGTPDWRPLLGPLPGAPGCFINFMPWLGFTAGPLASRITATLVQGKVPAVNVDFQQFLLK